MSMQKETPLQQLKNRNTKQSNLHTEVVAVVVVVIIIIIPLNTNNYNSNNSIFNSSATQRLTIT
jgi:hypothetical protein